MIESFGSILDFVHPGLDQGVWDKSGKLKPEHKKLIETEINKLIEQHGFKESDKWLKQIKIVGSLTTYQYVSDADLDVHVIVDIDQFIKTNNPKLSEKEATDFLDDARKQLDEQKILLPNTKHNLELYFETPTSGVDPKASIYDVKEDKWISDPVSVKYDFDVEEMKPFIVDIANTIAGEMDESFGEIKRNVKRVEELQEVMKEWPKEQRKLFKTKLEDKLQAIETEIKDLLKTKKEILTERREKYQQLSEQEIKFKYLQKFGYFYIISQLEDILEEVKELTVEEVPEIKDVMKEAQHDKHEHVGKLCIDFDSTITDRDNHADIGVPAEGVKEAFDKLKQDGWYIIIYSCRADTPKGVDDIKAFLDKHQLPHDEIFVGKPIAEYYIDDRNIVFTTWQDVIKNIQQHEVHDKLVCEDDHSEMEWKGEVETWVCPKCNKEKVLKKAQQTAKYDFSSTQVDLPKDTAQQIVEWGVRNIPDEELWDDETQRYGRELEPHVTVKYGILTNDVNEIKKVFEGEKPVKLKFGKTKFFKPEQYPHDVIVIEVASEDLHKLNKKVCDNLKNEDLYPNYQPHATIAYVKEGLGKKYEGLEVLPTDLEVTIDSVLISPKEGDRSAIELKAAFYPSIVQAPDNPRQQDSDVEIPVDPDPISQEETYFAPQVDKPRKSIVERILEFFKSKPEKEAAAFGIGYWIDPNGKLYDVRDSALGRGVGTHYSWIADNKKLMKQYGYNVNESLTDTFTKMIMDGWVRIGDSIGSQFEVHLNDFSYIPPAVENFVASHFKSGKPLQISDIQDHLLQIDEPFPSLQKAIRKELRMQKVHSFLKIATPPPVTEYLRTHKQPMGATELMEFRKQAPEDVQEEVDDLIDRDKLKDAWVLIEKYLGRRHLKFADCEECKKGNEPCDKCKKFYKPKTTWKNTEPFSPLQTTFTTTTNEENLNSRYPWKFMGKPKGPAYSNTNDVYEMIKGKKRISKKDKVAFTNLGVWIDPNGKVYDVRKPDYQTHYGWIDANLKMLQTDYHLKCTDSECMWDAMLQSGWVRVGHSIGSELGVTVQDIKSIPTTVDGYLAQVVTPNTLIEVGDVNHNLVIVDSPFPTLQQAVRDNRVPNALRGSKTKKADSCYTDKEMEDIYVKQHDMHDSPDGSTQPHDWNQSTTDYPKPEDLEVYKVRLDLLQKPIDRTTPMIPSYEVTWQFGLPQDQSEAFDE